jgi:hypothetical protein
VGLNSGILKPTPAARDSLQWFHHLTLLAQRRGLAVFSGHVLRESTRMLLFHTHIMRNLRLMGRR